MIAIASVSVYAQGGEADAINAYNEALGSHKIKIFKLPSINFRKLLN